MISLNTSLRRLFRDSLREYAATRAPVIYVFSAVITEIFLLEVWFVQTTSIESIRILATGLFGVHPALAWLLSPFLHRDVPHFVGNLSMFLMLGLAVERHWSKWRYTGFLIGVGYVSTFLGAGFMALFSPDQIAFYGSSGMVFALAGFALIHFLQPHIEIRKIEWFGVLIGILALVMVLIDPLTGPYLDSHWINGGHLAGFVLGLGFSRRYTGGECLAGRHD